MILAEDQGMMLNIAPHNSLSKISQFRLEMINHFVSANQTGSRCLSFALVVHWIL